MNDRPVPGDAWDPVQYSRFAAERARPFFDLLALVEPCPGGQVIDLGCGTGELTVRLHDHCRADATLGIDSSDAMLAKALPLAGNGLSFEVGDIGRFGATSRFDIVFANASLQWVPDHTQLLRRLARGLRPNGQLAVQVPANGDHPSHALAFEVAQESPLATTREKDLSAKPAQFSHRSATQSCSMRSALGPRSSGCRYTATSSPPART